MLRTLAICHDELCGRTDRSSQRPSAVVICQSALEFRIRRLGGVWRAPATGEYRHWDVTPKHTAEVVRAFGFRTDLLPGA